MRDWYEKECENGGVSEFGFAARDWRKDVVDRRLERIRLDA